MIDWTEIPDGDTWELFARDFLVEMGFVIDVGPGRGSDAGRDLIISEQLRGRIGSRKFTWLVSCKHNVQSGKSVGLDVEAGITDRLKQHGADGFIGFYSTLPSNSLVERLRSLEKSNDIASYEIFDGKKIEERFASTGLSKLALRYFPVSHGRLRPIQKFFGDYQGLCCDVCGNDLLSQSVTQPFAGNYVVASPIKDSKKIVSAHIACKGHCDRSLEHRLFAQGFMTRWQDIGDMLNPIVYLSNILAYANALFSREFEYSDAAHEKLKGIYIALAQRTLREVTEEDEKRFAELRSIEGL